MARLRLFRVPQMLVVALALGIGGVLLGAEVNYGNIWTDMHLFWAWCSPISGSWPPAGLQAMIETMVLQAVALDRHSS